MFSQEMKMKMAAGAMSGFLAAFSIDLHSWQTSGIKSFNWSLACGRWFAGAVSGIIAAFGASALASGQQVSA